jgi:hypothetical protein
LTLDDYKDGVPDPVREIRKLTLDVIKNAAQGKLGRCFEDHDLEFLDLYAMDFGGEDLPGFSFRRCFIIESSFKGSNLIGASYAGAFVRNVDFLDANLSGVNFTDADWFNAIGLTEHQLSSALKETVMDCPPDVESMHRRLEARYGRSFESWTTRVQGQLKAAWNEYLRAGGLRDVVAAWRQASR